VTGRQAAPLIQKWPLAKRESLSMAQELLVKPPLYVDGEKKNGIDKRTLKERTLVINEQAQQTFLPHPHHLTVDLFTYAWEKEHWKVEMRLFELARPEHGNRFLPFLRSLAQKLENAHLQIRRK
jgi:hypothetical protein